jgi:hypothetical protein
MNKSHANWIENNCYEIMGEYYSKSFVKEFHRYIVELTKDFKVDDYDFILKENKK